MITFKAFSIPALVLFTAFSASVISKSTTKFLEENKSSICPSNYSKQTFYSQNFSRTNVDIDGTFQKGFQWYRWNWGAGQQKADVIRISSRNVLSASGISGPNGQVMSLTAKRNSPYLVGTAFGGGFCAEAIISFDKEKVDSRRGFPAFWAMPFEHFVHIGLNGQKKLPLEPIFERFIELDFMEAYKTPFPQYLGSAIEWFGVYKKTCLGHGYCSVAKSFSNEPKAFPPNTDWNAWHRVGAVWIPQTTKAPGSIQYFFDGNPISAPITWRDDQDGANREPSKSSSLFSSIDRQHMIIIFGSGSAPIKVKSFKMMQSSEQQNISF